MAKLMYSIPEHLMGISKPLGAFMLLAHVRLLWIIWCMFVLCGIYNYNTTLF